MAEKSVEGPTAKSASKPRRWGRRLLLGVFCVAAAFILVELALRLPGVGPQAYAPRRFEPPPGVPYMFHAAYNQMVYTPRTIFSSVYDTAGDRRGYFGADGKVIYRLNMIGMRGPDVSAQKPPNGFRVLCLGDSITFGEGVREEDTYAMQLQSLLSAAMPDRKVEVLNEAVQGYGTKEAVNMYQMWGVPYQPDVVIVGFFLNDAMDFAETIRQNDAAHEELPLSRAARISRIWETVERRRHARALQAEYFESIRRSFQTRNWDVCKEALLNLRGDSIRRNFRLIVVVFPVLWELDGAYPLEDVHKLVDTAFHDLGLEYIDLLDVYRGRDAETLWVHPTDQHPNEIAHRLAAERIAQLLQPARK